MYKSLIFKMLLFRKRLFVCARKSALLIIRVAFFCNIKSLLIWEVAALPEGYKSVIQVRKNKRRIQG